MSEKWSDSDLTASKSDFRSTPRPDIADQAGHVSFVPISEVTGPLKPQYSVSIRMMMLIEPAKT